MVDDFAAQIRAFCNKALATANTVVQESTVNLSTALVERTPIDTTALRANWEFTVGSPGTTADYEAQDLSPGGADTSSTLAAQIREVPAGKVTYLGNSLDYMPNTEFGLYTNMHGDKRNSGKTVGGFSTQAPNGVMGITAMEWETFVDAAAAKVTV